MDELIEIIRREAQHATAVRHWKGTLLCTSYDPKKHLVKGMLMPEEIETGWIPISTLHAGKGFGILAGPKVGDASKAADGFDGDVFDVEFENGDPNTPIAKMKHFSQVDEAPEVKSGEILMKHEKGGFTTFKEDGSITTTHKDGGTLTVDANGHWSLDTKNKNLAVTTGTGSHTLSVGSGNLA